MCESMTEVNGCSTPCTAPELLLKVVLVGTLAHYETRGMIDEKRLEHILHAGKHILYKSHQESDVRQNLGFSPNVWQGLTDVLTKAVPVLEIQSFHWKNAPAFSYNGSSSDLIAANYSSLVKDIERLNDLCTIARNLLATTKKAQNLAADKGFDQQILKLIDVCVRVTARGFDGDANARNEERWQKVVNLYKRLLITCLQFLHNFIMHNEHRKLVLWLDLFGNSRQTETDGPSSLESRETATLQDATEARIKATVDQLPTKGALTAEGGLGYNIDDVHALFDLMSTEKPPDDNTQAAARTLMDKIRSDMERLSGLSASQLDEDPSALFKVGAALRSQLPGKEYILPKLLEESIELSKAVRFERTKAQNQGKALSWANIPEMSEYLGVELNARFEITKDDLAMPRTSDSAAETLQEAKNELMARLQETTPMPGADGDQAYDPSGMQDGILEDDVRSTDVNADSIDEEDEDDDGYRSPGSQERGLLTDVPLVLGPTEIEALPMIIQAGIVDSFGLKGGERNGAKNMQAVRCHILLAQEAGRDILRELLIFIAAWDLPDDEFYFKMMVQIMEAILKNGLMSHAYSDFVQAKDIISPAQAVVIKILTHIFRAKYSPASVVGSTQTTTQTSRPPAALSRVDVLTVRYIFTVFRGNIIPETCALIYLQGQIRAGHALAEDFPLNLWDMERVYEGVYQFLEFFAVLTESSEWKQLLVEWEIVYDLVTLIKELDASIPKASLTTQMPPPAKPSTSSAPRPTDEGTPTASGDQANGQTPVAIERPYDAVAPAVDDPENPTVNGTDADLEEDGGPSPPLGTEEPSDFEWRNLKKLIVLVLSSLVWKSPLVQNQIRKHGGVEVILGCTQYDAHNPYIKEHAVMCLKFLLENNRANQEVVESLEARGVVGGEDLLREVGVEAVVNEEGKVRLVKTTQLQQRRPSEGAAREHASRRNVGTNGATEPSEGHGSGFVEELDE